MINTQSHADIIRQISEICDRIQQILSELRPITNQSSIWAHDPAILEKEKRLQAEISRLHELREPLRKLVSD